MEKIFENIISPQTPDFYEMDYYKNLFAGNFTLEQTMTAQLQDLARSIGSLNLRYIQLEKLEEAYSSKNISKSEYAKLREVIYDELSAPGKRSHYEIRLQIFNGCGYSRSELETVTPLAETKKATKIFSEIFYEYNLFEITFAIGAIEKWYFPLAKELEKYYLKLGYSPFQVETFSIHKEADKGHSDACYSFVEKHINQINSTAALERVVKKAFQSVILYDVARYKAAISDKKFQDYLVRV